MWNRELLWKYLLGNWIAELSITSAMIIFWNLISLTLILVTFNSYFQFLIAATLLAACDCMQQASYGYQNPQATYQYQKPFTAFQQPQQLAYQPPQPAPYQPPQPAPYQAPQPAPYQPPQPAPYQYQQPAYQQVSDKA